MSVCAKFQLSSWSRSGLQVPGGVVGCIGVGCSGVWWLRPILVFSFSLGQAEQKKDKQLSCCSSFIWLIILEQARVDFVGQKKLFNGLAWLIPTVVRCGLAN